MFATGNAAEDGADNGEGDKKNNCTDKKGDAFGSKKIAEAGGGFFGAGLGGDFVEICHVIHNLYYSIVWCYNIDMNDAKEEIRARLPVEEVVGQYVELKRSGRTLKGRSPWGVDKTPSFMVSPEKGIWHDFSANKGADIFSFVM